MKPIHLAGLLPLLVAAQAATLFEDNFDREAPLSEGRNIQETLDGIANNTGTTFEPGGDPGGTPVYLQPHLDPNGRHPAFGAPDTDAANGSGTRIGGEVLHLSTDAPGTSNLLVNHNFVNAAIVEAGGFSVSLDILGYSQSTNGQGGGFAIGMPASAGSLSTGGGAGDSNNGNPRMTGGFSVAIGAAAPAQSMSDFWVVLRGNNTLVWGGRSGNVMGVTGMPSKVGTIAANFRFGNFDEGGEVQYEVLHEGKVHGSGTFTWSAAGTNFIGIDARDLSGVQFDNFRIAAGFVEPSVLPPFITAFEATTLGGGMTRLHWDIEGGPFDAVIQAGSTTLHTATDPRGFADVDAGGATDFTLIVSNEEGDDFLATPLAAENDFSAAVRAAGPVAWYRFNEPFFSSLVVDSADNVAPHNGTIIGNVSPGTPGPLDGAATFSGAGSSVLADFILDPAAVTPGYTIEAIVRRYPSSPGNAAIVSQSDGTGTGRSHLAVDNDGTIQTFLAGGPPQRKDADVKLPPNVWAHLVMVVDAATPEIRWYLDGVQIGSTADGTNPGGSVFDPDFTLESATGAWRIGTQKLANQNFWSGDMDEVAIYNFLLDDPADNRVPAHASAWLGAASGLLGFSADAGTIAPGDSTVLRVKVSTDITSVIIDNGVGEVTPVNGVASVTVSPSETTTYTITTQSAGSGTQTQLVTIVVEAMPRQAPEIVSATISGGEFHIVFRGAPSATYQIRGSLDLESFDLDLGTAGTDGAGEGSATVPLVPGRPRQFYRIEEIPLQ